MAEYRTDCRWFDGYKPCRFGRSCVGCPHHAPPAPDVLVINLDALGDVLRTTSTVRALRRAHPAARITWLTAARAAPLLVGNPDVDRVMVLGVEAQVELWSRRFDLVLNADKTPAAASLADRVEATERRGFGMLPNGAIVPRNPGAQALYDLGLDDRAKFFDNQRTELELLCAAWELPFGADPYVLNLAPSEAAPGPKRKVGFNTGCSPAYPFKKLGMETQAAAIRSLAHDLGEPVLLLGGPEDTERNQALAERLGAAAELGPTTGGLRSGAAEVDRCEVVVSGDSLGMHLAIARKKHVVAWFGVTVPAEIALFGRGIKLQADVGCAPCWRTHCDEEPKCFDQVSPGLIVQAVHDCLAARQAGQLIDEVRGATWPRR